MSIWLSLVWRNSFRLPACQISVGSRRSKKYLSFKNGTPSVCSPFPAHGFLAQTFRRQISSVAYPCRLALPFSRKITDIDESCHGCRGSAQCGYPFCTRVTELHRQLDWRRTIGVEGILQVFESHSSRRPGLVIWIDNQYGIHPQEKSGSEFGNPEPALLIKDLDSSEASTPADTRLATRR